MDAERMRNLEQKPKEEEPDERELKARCGRKEPGSFRRLMAYLVSTFEEEIREGREASSEKFRGFLKTAEPFGLTSLVQDSGPTYCHELVVYRKVSD